jgi:hypothetical protein
VAVGDDATDQPFQVYRIVREHLVVEDCLGNGDSVEAGLMLAIVFRQNDLQIVFSPNRNNSAYKWRSPQFFRDIHSKQQSTNEKKRPGCALCVCRGYTGARANK